MITTNKSCNLKICQTFNLQYVGLEGLCLARDNASSLSSLLLCHVVPKVKEMHRYSTQYRREPTAISPKNNTEHRFNCFGRDYDAKRWLAEAWVQSYPLCFRQPVICSSSQFEVPFSLAYLYRERAEARKLIESIWKSYWPPHLRLLCAMSTVSSKGSCEVLSCTRLLSDIISHTHASDPRVNENNSRDHLLSWWMEEETGTGLKETPENTHLNPHSLFPA